jgi:hypothetical protein
VHAQDDVDLLHILELGGHWVSRPQGRPPMQSDLIRFRDVTRQPLSILVCEFNTLFPITIIMPPITAESLLADLSAQLNSFLSFLKVDLSPVILASPAERGCHRAAVVEKGTNTYCWIQRLHEIHYWTKLAYWEQDWLQRTGRNKPTPCSGSHRLGTMATFIQQEGLPDNHNTKKALQYGRRLMRFESTLGSGITLLLIPVLPAVCRLSLAEEARTMEMIRGSDFTNIKHQAQTLSRLRLKYQCMDGTYPGKLIFINCPYSCLTFDRQQSTGRAQIQHAMGYAWSRFS